MATITTPSRRHHSPWLIVIEELLLVVSVFAVVVLLSLALGRTARVSEWVGRLPGFQATKTVSNGGALSFFAATRPMMQAIESATKLEAEGKFGEATRDAWKKAAEACRRFSTQPIVVSGRDPIQVWLLDAEEERAALLAEDLRDPSLTPSGAESLERLLGEAQANATLIRQYRDLINFDYWLAACESGMSEPGLRAHAATWEAERAFEAGDMPAAKEAYEQSFAAWREVLDASPVLRNDDLLADDLADLVGRYRTVLARLDEHFPEPFVLQAD